MSTLHNEMRVIWHKSLANNRVGVIDDLLSIIVS